MSDQGKSDTTERYRTAKGSTVEISSQHRGISTIYFDWFEEGACIEAKPTCDVSDPADGWLYWQCECCEHGQAKLEVTDEATRTFDPPRLAKEIISILDSIHRDELEQREKDDMRWENSRP